jgi:hypothetical protein
MIEVVVTVLVVAAIVVAIMKVRDKKEDTKEPSTGSGGSGVSSGGAKVNTVAVPDLDKMTKQKLEDYGRTRGIELDRRKTKANMLSDLRTHLK